MAVAVVAIGIQLLAQPQAVTVAQAAVADIQNLAA
jgi:hypothetical protein